MFCPKCGAQAGETARFCPKCGQALVVSRPAPSEPPPSEASPTKNPSSGRGNRFISLLPLLALILALGAGVLICGNASERTAPNEALLEEPEASAAALMAEGNAAFAREDYELALEFYIRTVELFPNEGDARSRAGDACYRLGREDEALGHYQAALMLYEDNTLPLQSAQNFYHLTEG